MESNKKDINRRDFLKSLGFGAAAYLSKGAVGGLATGFLSSGLAAQTQRNGTVEINLKAAPTDWQILGGPRTEITRFTGQVIKGPSNTFGYIPGCFMGPVIQLRKGDQFHCKFENETGENSIVHWHGLHVPESMDGHPRFAVASGGEFDYSFPITNPAGTYWYHPHPHMRSGPQVYSGLAGMMIVRDEEEDALTLPRGQYDLPIMLMDRLIGADNQFVYAPNMVHGKMGDRVLVNGQVNYEAYVGARAYRLRVLNASNARIYKLGWSDGTGFWVIGTDGGLLDKPVRKPYVMLAPGERVDLWVDFSGYPVGAEVKLKSLAFEGAWVGFGGGPQPRQGSQMDLMTFRVDRIERNIRMPEKLSNMERLDISQAINPTEPRFFPVSFGSEGFLLNRRPFSMTDLARNEVVQNNTVEVWEFENDTGNQEVAHPIHVHGPQFQVIGRSIKPTRRQAWEGVRDGYTDEGWKDTILLMPGEKARLLIKHGPHSGLLLYHCHNLEHEDMGMMRNFRVVD